MACYVRMYDTFTEGLKIHARDQCVSICFSILAEELPQLKYKIITSQTHLRHAHIFHCKAG